MYKPWPITCKRKKDQGGTERPVDPSSIFGTINPLCFTQTLVSPNRKVYSRSVSAESRSAKDMTRAIMLHVLYADILKNNLINLPFLFWFKTVVNTRV